jgi:hypothetical protein
MPTPLPASTENPARNNMRIDHGKSTIDPSCQRQRQNDFQLSQFISTLDALSAQSVNCRTSSEHSRGFLLFLLRRNEKCSVWRGLHGSQTQTLSKNIQIAFHYRFLRLPALAWLDGRHTVGNAGMHLARAHKETAWTGNCIQHVALLTSRR